MEVKVPTKIIIDCSTGEREILPLTSEEIAAYEQIELENESRRAAEEEAAAALAVLKASAKQKLIAGEPLTAEEADTLVL